jgi:peptidoglycan-N-acetylglucosamine deacetylase
MRSPRLLPVPGARRRLIVPVAAVLLLISAYVVSSITSTAPPDPSAAPPPSSPETPAGADEAWQFRLSQARAVPVAPSPPAGPGGPAGVFGGPSGTMRNTGATYVALTFDDGPDPQWTPQVLELLRTHGVRATFCVVGHAVQEYPELVRAIADDGHTLCNHSWGHDMSLGQRSRDEIRQDLTRTTSAIRAAVPGARVSYYRQPGGNWTSRVVEVAAELGMTSIHWDVDPRDWSSPGVEAIRVNVITHTRPGSIVLLHDGDGDPHSGVDRSQTVEALALLLPDLTSRLTLDALPPR